MTWSIVVVAALLSTRPGEVVADTKTYLSVDPVGLVERSRHLWDPSWGLGVVPHQNIGYLWPMGPWFSIFEWIGSPDWVAQRLWIAALLISAATGVMWLATVFGWSRRAGTVAGVVYALSPYALSYVTRISALALPWAGFGWLLGLAVLSARRGGWWRPAAFALVTMTVGGVNASSLMYVGLGVVAWFPFGVWVERSISLRQAATAIARIGLLTTATSLWWLAGLVVQGAEGAPVLQYSETTEVVASGSNAAEAFRGLGYWILYGGDSTGPWVEAGEAYTQSLVLIAMSFVLPVLALAAAAMLRCSQRMYLLTMMALGLVMTVGVHPFDDPSPLASLFNDAAGSSTFGLAIRSSPRALPLFVLGLAGFVGLGSVAVGEWWGSRTRRASVASWRQLGPALGAMLVAASALPALWTGGYVGGELARDEELPEYWHDVAAHLDATDDGTRTLTLPGADFSAHRWGNTIDHVLPGLTDRPTAVRELIAFTPAAAADLLIALDRRVQEGVADAATIEHIARRLGVGALVLQMDLEYERYRTARPTDVWSLVQSGDWTVAPFGPADVGAATGTPLILDERDLAQLPLVGVPAAAVAQVPDAVAPIRLESLERGHVVLVSGTGEGLVAAVDSGLVSPQQVVLYEGAIPDSLRALLDGAPVIVTDSDRARARRWKTVRDNVGFTERADGLDRIDDPSDARLDVLPGEPARTTALQVGATAWTTGYGNVIAYHPENRAVAAVDGDPTTSWRASAFGAVADEAWTVVLDEPVTSNAVRLLQPVTGDIERRITEIDLVVDGAEPRRIALDATSWVWPGQTVDLGASVQLRRLDITVVATSPGESPVGFAEVSILPTSEAEPPTVSEIIVTDSELAADADLGPVAVVFERLRTDPANVVREDTETTLRRQVSLRAFSGVVGGVVHLSPRADDLVVDRAVVSLASSANDPQLVAAADTRLPGPVVNRGAAAFDDDLSTAWVTPFGGSVGASVSVVAPAIDAMNEIEVVVRADGRHSLPAQMSLAVDGAAPQIVAVDEWAAIDGGLAVAVVPWRVSASSEPVELAFTVDAIDALPTIDLLDDDDDAPIAIASIALSLPSMADDAATPRTNDECRSDLVVVNGQPLAVRLTGIDDVDALERGAPARFVSCDDIIHPGGPLLVEGADGRITGFDVDLLWIDEGVERLGAAGSRVVEPHVVLTDETPTRRRVEVPARDEPMLLVLNDSFSNGWHLEGIDTSAGSEPFLVDGHANGWVLPAGPAVELTLQWRPQRIVDVALLLSGIAVIACLVLLSVGRRRTARVSDSPADEPAPVDWRSMLDLGRAERLRPSAIVASTLATAVVAGVLTRPAQGVVSAVLLAAAVQLRRPRAVLVVAAAFVAAAGAYEIYLQGRFSIGHGGHWPSDMARAHELAWMAVALLLAHLVHAPFSRRGSVEIQHGDSSPDGRP